MEGRRPDYTRLFKSLKTLKEAPSKLYENVVAAFDVQNVTCREAEEAVALAKDTILKVRNARTELLNNAVKVVRLRNRIFQNDFSPIF